MADLNRNALDRDIARNPGAAGMGASTRNTSAEVESLFDDNYWRDSFAQRPYVKADLRYEFYQPAYRYGHESAHRYRGREWNEAEPALRKGWDRYEHRGAQKSTWDEIKEAVRDAWDRVRGKEHATPRTSSPSDRF